MLQGYDLGEYYDEMFEAPGVARPHYRKVMDGVGKLAPVEFEDRRFTVTRFTVAEMDRNRIATVRIETHKEGVPQVAGY